MKPQGSGKFEDARKHWEPLFSPHIPMPTSSESQHPISGAPSHQEDPALPQMQDIFLDLRSLFPPGLHICSMCLWIPGCHWPSAMCSQCWHSAAFCGRSSLWAQSDGRLSLNLGLHQLPASRAVSGSALIAGQPHLTPEHVWI